MEFNIIDKYFNWQTSDKTINYAVGDDCGLITNTSQLAITTDTLISGVHFPKNTSAFDIAYKALMVNLSDLAAMGATPKYFTLGLSLPNIDDTFLAEFSKGLHQVATTYNISLIGGDTTKSDVLSITITAIGECKSPLMRSGAKVGDSIFVSGVLGGGALALYKLQQNDTPTQLELQALNNPVARVELGMQLRGIATSCIDISDGLIQDLTHILRKSSVGANLESKQIPLFTSSTIEQALRGGDDYELCFTAKDKDVKNIENITRIGTITKELGLTIDNTDIKNTNGYLHF